MDQYNSTRDSTQRRQGLLRDQVQLVKIKDCDRYEIVPIEHPLSFEKGFFVVVRACQLLAQKNDGIVLVGVAGPSGAGKTVFTEKIHNFMPGIAVISMDDYNDSSRIIDGNFDDPRLTDYDTLLENIHGLKEGKSTQVPIYDFRSSNRIGYRTVDVPSSRIVILEGIYALSEKLRPLLDLRVSVTGGVHFDLVKRVLRDIQRARQQPEEIIYQISETVYPMYKAFIEPDLQTAHIKISNKFNPFTGFQNPSYILKSSKTVSVDQIKAVLFEEHNEGKEETYDIYLLPPGEDPEACQSYLRMRNKDGKYSLMFEEWVMDSPFIISPRITFEVGVRLLGGLMALGYSIAAILKRSSHVFSDDRVVVKMDWLEQLNRHYIQVQGKDRLLVREIAERLGLEGSFIPRTYIEQIQLEKLINEMTALPDELKTKLSIDNNRVSTPTEAHSWASSADNIDKRNGLLKRGISHTYSAQGDKYINNLSRLVVDSTRFDGQAAEPPAINQEELRLLEQISTLNERIYDISSQMEEISSKISSQKTSTSHQNLAVQSEACNCCLPRSMSLSKLGNGTFFHSSSYPAQLNRDSELMDELKRGQHQIRQQLCNLSNSVHEHMSVCAQQSRTNSRSRFFDLKSIGTPLLIVGIGGISSFFLLKVLHRS